jgi:hypothetical protein
MWFLSCRVAVCIKYIVMCVCVCVYRKLFFVFLSFGVAAGWVFMMYLACGLV